MARRRDRAPIHPLAFGYYIADQLLVAGAQIDKVLDLPLTVTIRFTMKSSSFKQKVSDLISWNLSGEIEDKLGQVIDSVALGNDIVQYEVMFVKNFFIDDIRQLSA